MIDFIPMENVVGKHEVGFKKQYFYAIGIHGVDIYSLLEQGPYISCSTEGSVNFTGNLKEYIGLY